MQLQCREDWLTHAFDLNLQQNQLNVQQKCKSWNTQLPQRFKLTKSKTGQSFLGLFTVKTHCNDVQYKDSRPILHISNCLFSEQII